MEQVNGGNWACGVAGAGLFVAKIGLASAATGFGVLVGVVGLGLAVTSVALSCESSATY